MRRFAVVRFALSVCLLAAAAPTARGPPTDRRAPGRAARPRVRSGPVDGVRGPLTRGALARFPAEAKGSSATEARSRDPACAPGGAGAPLLGQRSSPSGRSAGTSQCSSSGSAATGFPSRAVDGRFTWTTAAAPAATSAGTRSIPTGSRARTPTAARDAGAPGASTCTCTPRRELFLDRGALPRQPAAARARNRLSLMRVIVPGQRFLLPRGARLSRPRGGATGEPRRHPSRDRPLGSVYGVDPQLARALAWMESGFQQDVVSSVGALGVMQLLPETWEFVDTVLLGVPDAAHVRGQRPRRRRLPPLAARRVRRERPAGARGLVPGRAGRT